MGEDVIGNYQRLIRELGQEDLYLLGELPAIGIEKQEIEWSGKLAGNLRGVARAQLDVVEQIRAPEILARQGELVGIAIDADDTAARGRKRPCQPDGAVGVRGANLERASHAAGAHQNAEELRAGRLQVKHHARAFGRARVVLQSALLYFVQ